MISEQTFGNDVNTLQLHRFVDMKETRWKNELHNGTAALL